MKLIKAFKYKGLNNMSEADLNRRPVFLASAAKCAGQEKRDAI
ncbi:hypothetical protein RYZ26_05595 [Terasakiella sp. A23]|nr:hypothetical protein [Terasakiella sp. A23]